MSKRKGQTKASVCKEPIEQRHRLFLDKLDVHTLSALCWCDLCHLTRTTLLHLAPQNLSYFQCSPRFRVPPSPKATDLSEPCHTRSRIKHGVVLARLHCRSCTCWCPPVHTLMHPSLETPTSSPLAPLALSASPFTVKVALNSPPLHLVLFLQKAVAEEHCRIGPDVMIAVTHKDTSTPINDVRLHSPFPPPLPLHSSKEENHLSQRETVAPRSIRSSRRLT